ncbi:oligosaccharide repeat unit polymerase [Cyanobium sp. HWJ4-Hawea]|uniref:hypothetical protein n=1 Tax=Cyanobium sp. HWJ4-Hawea TaxID=2823713 RepID=UPI0020CC3740|nr:hypothetical protein [Cyanobium sp. HWJ4-Hawea]MCP9808483.1 oligosaccharide repeat unit polymerase [Cyanobium sp. HWJ4-Hawea]
MRIKLTSASIAILLAFILYNLQLTLALINPFSFYPISSQVILSSVAGSLALATAFLLKKPNLRLSFNNKCSTENLTFSNTYFWIALQIVQLLISLFIFIFSFSVLSGTGFNFSEARSNFFFSEISLFKNVPGFLFFLFVANATFKLVSASLVISLVFRRSIPRLTLLSFFSYFLFSFVTGSRTFIYELLLYLILSIVSVAPNGVVSFSYFWKILKRTGLFFIPFVPLFLSRTSESFSRFLYVYMIGPLFFFSQLISYDNAKAYDLQNLDRFGFSFASLDWIIIGVYNIFNQSDKFLSLFTLIDYPIGSGAMIGFDQGLNAFPSGFFYSYMDGGVIFVYLLIFLFALSLKYLDLNSFKCRILFVILGSCLIDVLRTGPFASPSTLFSILFLTIL